MGWIEDISTVFLPRKCHLCGALLHDGERHLCTPCVSRLPRTLYHRMHNNPMEMLFAGIVPFERATAHFFYAPGSNLAQLIQDFKYRNFPSVAERLGEIIGSELLPVGFFYDIDGMLPVPLHSTKRLRRGYNQAECLAQGISRQTDIPVLTNLVALRAHRTQTAMTHEERNENIRGVFDIKNPEELRGKHLLILDDVCTTGSTLREAALSLIARQPHLRISILSLCLATV